MGDLTEVRALGLYASGPIIRQGGHIEFALMCLGLIEAVSYNYCAATPARQKEKK